MSATMGIAAMAYLPFCIFNLLDVMVTFLFAILGFKIRRTEPEEATFRGVGRQRVGPTKHEVTVRGG
jgi:Na+/H+ antiporter NhaC